MDPKMKCQPETNSKCFYDQQYLEYQYAAKGEMKDQSFYPTLSAFLERFDLHDKHCLEIGCGRGVFQDIAGDYIGLDLSYSAGKHLQKPFVQASATSLPFSDHSFDVIWSYAVLEHIHDPESCLEEIRRVLKPKGFLLLEPAWYCRTWAANGYPVRRFSELNLIGKLIKASIPLRNMVLWRSISVFPRRIFRLMQHLLGKNPTRFLFRKLKPNFDRYWMSDSDAIAAMDPFEALLWFSSRGDICLNYPTFIQRFFVRSGSLIIRRS